MSSSACRLGLILACAVLITAAAPVAGSDSSERTRLPQCAPDELFIKFRPGADPAIVTARYGGTIKSEIAFIGVHVVSISPGTAAEKGPEFQADPEVEYAEAVGVVTIPESPPSDSEPCGHS